MNANNSGNSNTTIKTLISKIDMLLSEDSKKSPDDEYALTPDEKQVLKDFIQFAVAVVRMKKFGVWLAITIGLVYANWERVRSFFP